MIRTCFHTIPDAAKETTQSSLAGGLATLLESSQRSTQLIRTCFHTIPDAAKETTQSSLAGGLATLLESSQLLCQPSEIHPAFASQSNEAKLRIPMFSLQNVIHLTESRSTPMHVSVLCSMLACTCTVSRGGPRGGQDGKDFSPPKYAK